MNLPFSRPALWLSIAEFTSWILFTLSAMVIVFTMPFVGLYFGIATIVTYLTLTCVMAWVRSARWFDAKVDGDTRAQSTVTFVLAPLYAILSLFILLPLRFVVLVTLRTTSWGTRKHVEVRMETAADPIQVPGGSTSLRVVA